MLTIIVLKGLPGSGKTTWSNELISGHPGMYKRIATDDLRKMFDCSKWSPDNEKFMLQARDVLILKALEDGKHVIVDATNLNPTHERHIRELVKSKADVIIQDFTAVTIEECIKRDLIRPNSVGEKVIRDMYNKYVRPTPNKVIYNSALPSCIICDLDGTLALSDWRNPYDASQCEKDEPNLVVVNLLRSYLNWLKTTKIIFVSGREEKYRDVTEKWLNKIFWDFEYNNFIQSSYSYSLYMRPTQDTRKDYVVKKEIYEREIKKKYKVCFVIDDRLQVCRMWYEMGLPLLKVGDPDADF